MNDYQLFLSENNITDDFVRMISQDTSSQMLLDHYYSVSVRPSEIEGQGLFADKDIKSGMGVVPALLDGKKTIGGRFTNHSGEPNAELRSIGGNKYLIALRDIKANEEITTNYRVAKQLQEDEHIEKIAALTSAIDQAKDAGYKDGEIEPNHYFAHGTYTRELSIKKGTFLAGKIHRYNCITIVPYGHCRMITDKGDFDVIGPQTLVTGTGSKGIYAYEDTLLITVHPWSGEHDLNKVEEYVICSSYEENKL